MQLISLPIRFIFMFVLSMHATTLAAEDWHTSIDEAVKVAKASNKPVLVKFTGSDWCPPCQEIDRLVFSKKEFTDEAAKNFVLCIIDSPKKDQAIAKKNAPLIEKYAIKGYPTVILLDPSGEEFSRFFPTAYENPNKMLSHLHLQLKRKSMF